MKLMINTASTFKGGSIQVARSFVEECKNYPEHDFHVVLGERLAELIDESVFADNFCFYRIGYRPATRVLRFSGDHFLQNLEKKVTPDVVFTTSGPAYWRPQAPHVVGYNLPHYVYEDSPFFAQIPFRQRLKWKVKGKVIKHFFKRDADAYVVQTDDVAKRLKNTLGVEKVYTVSNTVSHFYNNPEFVKNKLPKRENGEFRFLTLSAWYRHKNLGIIPKVIKALPEELREHIRFVVTLPQDVFDKEISGRFHKNIINVGPVKPDEGPSLYGECDALFLPTLLECFSASYAEAMVMGKPIVTSDLDFAHDLCCDAALYADPLDARAFADKIKALVGNYSLQEELVQNGFKRQKKFATARTRAQEYLRICKELADEERK